jgi:ATP-binding cassette subfamily F protein uup
MDETVMFGSQRLGVRSYLKRFLFTDDRVNERVGNLSGGERARLMLAKVLKRGGNVIVLDEPTNDLDLPSLRMLEEALADFDGSVLVVSHDRYFLDRVCDQIVAFEDAGVFVQPGNYSYYLEKKKERDALLGTAWSLADKTEKAAARTQKDSPSKPRKLTMKEQRELEGMEAAILAEEEKAAAIETTLNDPEFYITRSLEAPALTTELEAVKAEVHRLYERWEELNQIAATA